MICFRDVSYAYEPGRPVCEGLNLELDCGLVLLLGPNGCGKSTLMKLASGVEKPDAGSVTIDGRDLWKEEVAAREQVAYLPEYPDLTPYATLDEILGLVCRLRDRPLGEGREALDFFGLQDLSHHTVRELSLGQRRQAVFAAVLVGTPRHILLDEPLSGMDRAVQTRILDWIARRGEEGALLLVVSHEIEPFLEAAGQIVTLKEGRAKHWEELPESPQEKLALIEQAARGNQLLL
jgi:ABC-type multidrug transport system ATPase subunit